MYPSPSPAFVSYPALKIYADGGARDALNYNGPADHDDVFAALLAQLATRPESKGHVTAFERHSS